jgi:hypothetical protein
MLFKIGVASTLASSAVIIAMVAWATVAFGSPVAPDGLESLALASYPVWSGGCWFCLQAPEVVGFRCASGSWPASRPAWHSPYCRPRHQARSGWWSPVSHSPRARRCFCGR